MKESRTISRVVAAVLTVAFLGYVFTAFAYMIIHYGDNIIYASRMTGEMAETLPDNPTRFDRLAARINGFTNEINNDMWGKTELGYFNSSLQYALGKKLINTGSANMITLTTGHLYDVNRYRSLDENAQEIIDLRNTSLKDYPFLFVYEHPTLYREDMMPEDYKALDQTARMADEVTAALRDGGINLIDSREVLNNSGYDLDELLMVTDQHWSTKAAIVMAQSIAEKLNAEYGAALDSSLLDLDRMDTKVYEKLFLGKYGQRIGVKRVDPDDIVEYLPKYDTWIHRHTLYIVNTEDAEGPFDESVFLEYKLAKAAGRTWSASAYTDYGLVESYNIFTNENAPDYTILLLKDSYSAPIGSFLSLVARNVVCIDLRRKIGTVDEWAERYHPDVVVMAYSLSMLRDDDYQFQ